MVVHKYFPHADIDTDIGHHIKVLLVLDIVLLGYIGVVLHIDIDTFLQLHFDYKDIPYIVVEM